MEFDGDYVTLRWLISKALLEERAAKEAARVGDLQALVELRKNRGYWSKSACTEAAANGRLSILVYLHEEGCPWDKRVCREATRNGHLDCLRYAFQNGCPYSASSCCYGAARNGHLDCLQYLCGQGCLCNESTYKAALLYMSGVQGEDPLYTGDRKCLEYLQSQDCPTTFGQRIYRTVRNMFRSNRKVLMY